MAFQEIQNVEVVGLSAALPRGSHESMQMELLGDEEARRRFVELTGIVRRRSVRGTSICASDLCLAAAERLIDALRWERSEIDALIFVSQTPDYILPATACVLQDRLKLSTECFAMDISLGCSGWVYGLSVVASLLSSGGLKKALLLTGDTVSVTKSPHDKSTYPLFGDAGTATALVYAPGTTPIQIHTATDGSHYKDIMIRDGGFRHWFTIDSLQEKVSPEGILRSNLHSTLDGVQVFTYGMVHWSKSVKHFLQHFAVDQARVDYFIFHQANKLLNEKIRTKLNLPQERVPGSIAEYGNTGSASIPLTLVSQLGHLARKQKLTLVASGFGAGFSWGTALFEINRIVCPEIVEI